ncbi:MAG: putative metal-binding motif-containing protein [Labilithrix sp.]|nr:putative metal-binding motif-containing protein [Labilithrix sp.]MCW5816987.1 putative metal-binding motif-containing protein [Labilithrix sp.]
MKALLGASALSSVLVLAFAPAGCGTEVRDRFVASLDAGPEAEAEAPVVDAGGVDPTIGGPCNDDGQCDDQIPCTFDRCDQELGRCRNTPDDAQCQDGAYCNGSERCVLRQGCAPGPVVTCSDGDGCTIDRCVEGTQSCEHVLRDVDGDGDPDYHCNGGGDCDDTDPTVSSKKAEICGNFKDDNCDGRIDEQPCSVPENDTCATATTIATAGTYLLSTVATKPDYGTSCATSTSGQDIVVAIRVPADGARDVLVRARTNSSLNAEVGLTLQRACGDASQEIQCQRVPNVADARAIARRQAAGSTVYAVVATRNESIVDLGVAFLPPTDPPANESCASPAPIALDQAAAVSLIDAKFDLSSDCHANATGGELTYSFELTEERDVRIFASRTLGTGAPIVSLRDPASCTTDELACRAGESSPLFKRRLAKGVHVVSVAATTQIDASIIVKTSPPTDPLPEESCATAPEIEPNKTKLVSLTDHEDAIDNGCGPGFADAAFKLTLDAPSDVLVIGRFPFIDQGMVSLSPPACDAAIACTQGSTPQRVSRRNQPAGEYRVVVGDQLSESALLFPLVRPTVPPTVITAGDGCTDAFPIPDTGGYFTGDTTDMTADFSAGCDQTGQPAGTAKDQLGKLVLTQRRRVVFDMSGSDMQTILDLRQGEPCPGIELSSACHVGTGPGRSFLDITLDPGTYYVQIDGYNGATGKWALDVRVLEP